MANKKFLEEYPLYRKYKTDWCGEDYAYSRKTFGNLPKPAIHMYCDVCDSDQTFNMQNEYYENAYFCLEERDEKFRSAKYVVKTGFFKDTSVANKVTRLDYICSACRVGKRVFLVKFMKEKIGKNSCLTMIKVGQYPEWSIEMDKQLEKELGGHSQLYEKGLISEAQGYGIGAFAYYRQITETVIDGLLDSIVDLFEGDEKVRYESALAETKKTTATQKKIDLVKDLLPVSLRPDGMNPLSTLHSALSEGLHAETDGDCLDYAEEIRSVLTYLVNQVERSKSSSKSFTASMRKILDKRSGKQQENKEMEEKN